VRITQKQGVGE